MAARKYLAEHPDLSGSANGNTDTSDAGASAPTPAPPTSSDPQAKSHLLDIPRATRVMISLTGKSWERALLWRLDWMNFLYPSPAPTRVSGSGARLTMLSKVLSLLATGYRIDAAKIIVQQVLVPRGLTGLATDTLDYSTVEMREVFGLLAGYRHPRHRRGPRSGSGSGPQQDGEEEDEDEDYGYYDYDYEVEYGDDSGDGEEKSTYPLLIHCTQGKDRTGLIIILLLLLLLSPTPTPTPKTTESQPQPQPPSTSPSVSTAITTDYTRSETELLPEADDRLKELFELGIPESFLKCPPEFTDAIRAYLHERYGGVRGYLDYIGVGRQMQEGIRRRLLC